MRFTQFILLLILGLPVMAQEPQKPYYYPTGNEGVITGTITLKGTPPKLGVIDMTADPSCQDLNRNPRPDWVITNQGRLANAFVFGKGETLNTYQFEMPDSEMI